MGRYRPPQKPGAKYITPEGFQKLEAELKYLWRDKRPKVTQAVSEAAAQGDRSENAEYIYGKKQLREIDRRIRYLQKRLDDLQIVNAIPDDQKKIFFGAWVELEDEEGGLQRFRIVGPDEADAGAGKVSVDSPISRALLGKSEGDEVSVELPKGLTQFYINAVHYKPQASA
jgi:transcription elongation factor GreB